MNKVRITIEFEQTQPDGSVSKVQHTEEQSVANSSTLEGIDSCEKVVLQTAYAAMRGAVSEQMSAVSKKKIPVGSSSTSRVHRVRGEIGTFSFSSYYDSKGAGLFSKQKGKAYHLTESYKEVVLFNGVQELPRVLGAADSYNRQVRQADAQKSRRIQEQVEQQAAQYTAHLASKSETTQL